MELRLVFIVLVKYKCTVIMLLFSTFYVPCSQCFPYSSSWKLHDLVEKCPLLFLSYKCEIEVQIGKKVGPKSPSW